MPRVASTVLRPALIVGLLSIVVAVLMLSRCSSQPGAVKKPVAVITTTTSAPPPPPAPPPFTAKGLPAELSAVIKPLYFGGSVRSSPEISKVLHKRKVVKAGGQVVASGAVSTFKGVPIAAVTRGKDVTLAVKAPRWKVVGGWWPSVGLPSVSLGGDRRILLAGSDARPGQPVNRSRADSLHIVGVDGRGGGGVLGIARDSYVSLPGGGKGKINSALTLGGPAGLQRTVASATGVKLEGYVITGFSGFTKIIDGMGGLRLNAPLAVKDANSGANVKAGSNLLSGGEALSYGRARYEVPGGDFGRSANQGLLILAAGGFAKVQGPARLPGILHKAAPFVTTNLTAEQVLTLAAATHVTSPRKVPNRVAAGSFGMTSDRQSIVRWDDKARRLFADIRNGNLK